MSNLLSAELVSICAVKPTVFRVILKSGNVGTQKRILTKSLPLFTVNASHSVSLYVASGETFREVVASSGFEIITSTRVDDISYSREHLPYVGR